MSRSADDTFGRKFATALDQTEQHPAKIPTRRCLVLILLVCLLVVLFAAMASASGQHRIYDVPADVKAARSACFLAERESRGIPGERDAYIAWFEANRGTEVWRNWRAAYRRCRDQHTQPGGKWNWGGLIFVGEGLLR